MDGWDVGLILAAGADMATTVRALKQPGVREGNPFAPESIEAMVAVKTLGTAGLIWVRHVLDGFGPVGHKVGIGLMLLGMAAFSIAAAANLRF